MDWQKLRALGPSGPGFPRALWSRQPKDVSTTAWIDGVRGLAALIVAVDHLFWHVIGPLFQGYKSFPPEAHSSILQLPGPSIIFSAFAMVPLFFVISGYCISLSSIRARAAVAADPSALLTTLSAAVFRRGLRLALPVVAIALLSQLVYALGGYSAWPWHEDRAALPPPGDSSLRAHAGYLFSYFGALFDQVLTGAHCGGAGTQDCPVGLNGQMWTIPLELRGSLLVYLCVLGTARVRPAPRKCLLGLLAAAMLWRAWWEGATFVGGLLIAEATRGGDDDEAHGGDLLLLSPGGPEPCWLPRWHRRRRDTQLRNAGAAALAAVGVWLLCVPNAQDVFGGYGPCYNFLFARFTPARWFVGEARPRADFCWRAVGGMAVVAALADGGSLSAVLRRPFFSAAAQYFGRISFMLYLVHIMVFECLLLRLQIPLIGVLGMDRINLAGNVARVLLLPLAFWVSEALVEVLDKRSIALAKRLSVTWATSSSSR